MSPACRQHPRRDRRRTGQRTPEYARVSPAVTGGSGAQSASAACDDALSLAALAPVIDAIFAVRTVADSVAAPMRAQMAPFGSPENVPASVAKRLGARPRLMVYSPACGDEPQKLVNEACERLHSGELKIALVCGGEASDAALENRSWNVGTLRTRHMNDHKMIMPTTLYAMFENARRERLGFSRDAYAHEMGRLMSPFSSVAAANPHTAGQKKVWSADEIATISADNRMIADPHPISVVARDQVNLGAAVLLTTVGTARKHRHRRK